MRFIADLHIHSHFSRATSKELVPERLHLWAQKKGIKVVGTGDFTHPGWLKELEEKLRPAEDGLYCLAPQLATKVDQEVPPLCRSEPRFLLTGEISCIYKRRGKVRKIHHLVLMKDMEAVRRLNSRLSRVGNIKSDGRPIFGLDSRDLLEMVLEADEGAFFIPAHIWTPWFSLFGSKSGFDSVEECFGDLTPHIFALETGLSSDPPMNRRLSALDDFILVSNSDAHSPAKLGREANIFDTEPDYPHMVEAMKSGEGFVGTIEFFPEEGKYHLDGHRRCGIRLSPSETRGHGGICPGCGRPLTVGVLHRVEELADRQEPKLLHQFVSLIPLAEIISEVLGAGPATKKVLSLYEKLLEEVGPEFHVLMDAPLEEIERVGGYLMREAIGRMRAGRVIREEGFDGQYGVIRLFEEGEKEALMGQHTLFKPVGRSSKDRPSPSSREQGGPVTSGKVREPKKGVSWDDPILGPLNQEQLQAATHLGGHLLVVAGPGTGKTMVLTHRIAHLIREGEAKAEQILALTFTRKAAQEMEQRLVSLIGEEHSSRIRISTFHGLYLELLEQKAAEAHEPRALRICTEEDSLRIAYQVLSSRGVARLSPASFLQELYSWRLSELLGRANPKPSPERLSLYSAYRERLAGLNLVDFNELELETLNLFLNEPGFSQRVARRFPWVFVDEYQDTNTAQTLILKAVARSGAVVFAIGDPDQAIYGFRGADVSNFHRFSEDFPGTREIVLTTNYRSSQNILDAASAIIKRKGSLRSVSHSNTLIWTVTCSTESEEAEMVVETVERLMGGVSYFSVDSGRGGEELGTHGLGFGDFAVLYRLNAQGDALEEALSRRGVPVVRSGERPILERYPVDVLWRFFQAMLGKKERFYLAAYEELLDKYHIRPPVVPHQMPDTDSIEELVNWASRVHGLDSGLKEGEEECLERFRAMAARFQGPLGRFLSAVSLERGIDHQGLVGDRVALMSLHAAKGLQWEVVFITGCEDGLIPCTLFGAKEQEEEKRLFYVGITRAKSRLILSRSRKRKLGGRLIQLPPSPYLNSIPVELKEELNRTSWKRMPRGHQQLTLF